MVLSEGGGAMSVETQSGLRRGSVRDVWESRALAEVLAELKRDRLLYIVCAT